MDGSLIYALPSSSPRPPGGLMATVEHVGDVVDAFGTWSGIACGCAQIHMPQASGHLVNRNARLETMGGPVGPERVRVREAIGNAGGPGSRGARGGRRPHRT
jgi:hypothetical protein